MARKKKNKKIVRYRRPLNINVGMIIFALIFVYMVFSVYTYLRRDKIQFYEVVEGRIVNDKEYNGIILRQETPKMADRSGYINYYIREGKKAAVGTKIYSIDETGSMSSLLADNPDAAVNLTDENLQELKKQLSGFSTHYNDLDYHSVYDTKYTMDAAVLEYVNFNTLDNLDEMMSQMGINFVQVRSDQAGVISYSVDSYESLDSSQISAQVFDKTNYSKAITKSGQLVEKGAPVYKVITSDLWSVVFPIEQDDIERFGSEKRLRVNFNGTDLSISGDFTMITGTDGAAYGKLDFDKCMVQFESDRYVNFEIDTGKVDGLKIPVSAVTEKNFYLVPIDYLTQGGDSMDSGFLKETYSDSGTSTVFVPTTLYYNDGEYYYIDASTTGENGMASGDYIVKPNSTDRYQLGTVASLQGVYNINKGYAVFKQIQILSSNEEYYTVKKNTDYGLAVYDHIVLDASTVLEGELIYQ